MPLRSTYQTRVGVRIELLGRSWPAVTVPVTLRLRPFDDPWDAGVDFVLDEGLPFGLLGYEGFLNRWAVSFNAYEGYFVVEPVEDFHQRLPPDPLRALVERGPDPYQAEDPALDIPGRARPGLRSGVARSVRRRPREPWEPRADAPGRARP